MKQKTDPTLEASDLIDKGVALTLEVLASAHHRDKALALDTSIILETTQRKFEVWRQTWFDSAYDPDRTAEILWGKSRWDYISHLIQKVMQKAKDIKFVSQKIVSLSARSRWKFVLSGHPRSKLSALYHRGTLMRDLVNDLCACSQTAFDSLHGLTKKPAQASGGDKRIADSIQGRKASLMLYRYLNSLRQDFSLDIDLFRSFSDSKQFSLVKRSSVSSILATTFYYRIFTQAGDSRAHLQNYYVVGILTEPRNRDSNQSAIAEIDYSDLKSLAAESEAQNSVVKYQPYPTSSPFPGIIKPLSTTTSFAKSESLIEVLEGLDSPGSTSSIHPLTLMSRFDLAFKLAESGFYLLGTPWFASLSCRRLKRIPGEESHGFALEIQTLYLEDLAYDDPQALSESFQLFNLGVVLIEIALRSDIKDKTDSDNRYMKTSEMLPKVEQDMGAQYCKAAAFCLQERQYGQNLNHRDKYERPGEMGWQTYLEEFLVEYDAQVLSR